MTAILITPHLQKIGKDVFSVVRCIPWGGYHLKGELVQSNQSNSNNQKQKQNKKLKAATTVRITKVREGSQEGFGEEVGEREVNP